MKYPESLKNACTPTFTNIAVMISDQGVVEKILLSDSAPKSFKDNFNEIKYKLDLRLLKPVIAAHKLKNCAIMISVFYVYGTDYCVNSFEPIDYIANNYVVFEGKALDRLTYNLKPIIVSMAKPMY